MKTRDRPFTRDWASFWDDKSAAPTDFEATGRRVLDIVAFLYLVRDVAVMLDLGNDDEVLDIGCGTGIVALALSGFVRSIHAVDISQGMVARAKANCAGAGNITFGHGSILDPGASGRRFRKVLAYSVLQYLSDEDEWHAAFETLERTLEPGGRACYAANPDLSRKDAYIARVRASDRPEPEKDKEVANIETISWVAPDQAVVLARKAGLTAEWRPMNPRIWQHFYMYDLVLKKDG